MIPEVARPPAPAAPTLEVASDAPPDAARDGPTVRRVQTLAEYHECVAIQRETWGADFNEFVSATILQLAQKLGGVVAGAFASDGRMLGFVFGMTGIVDGRLVHWSDMLAVRPEARGDRLGERLKHYQRGLARATGAQAMYWTFDPLVARNAHLNLARLGARVVEYVPNMYGDSTGSPLHGALPTDRLVVEWDLSASDGASGARVAGDGVPRDGVAPDSVPSDGDLRIPIPPDVQAVAPDVRAAWRATTRDAFLISLGRGYVVRSFHRGTDGVLPYYALARAA